MRMGIEEASGWDVVVGPENASSIPAFLRERQGESRFEQEGSA